MAELERGRVVHAVPGRVRIKLETRALAEERGARLRRALLALQDVEEVQTTPRTGSVVIVYDPDVLDTPGLIAQVRQARLLALDPYVSDQHAGRQVPLSQTAQGIWRTFRGVNAQLSEMTNGRWDLRSVFPFALGAMALRSFLANPGSIGAAPWWVLAWYAFDSFLKLNQGEDRAVAQEDHDIFETSDE
jgi:hypothetical protein